MKIARIKETSIYVTDLQRSKEFYSHRLGLPVLSYVESRHVFFRAGESVLLCFISENTLKGKELPPHGATGVIHFAFEVERKEYDATLLKVKNMDIKILYEQVWKDKLRSFYFNDPDGHLLEIIEEGIWKS